ncbi:MAG TPA: helix-turn-helix transcriptional regulator [Candidatus Companilactobacillus pullicola]|uniref:Helix-turn-helix transcriptional regulator n=2 Tax=Companilactobacillus TaxID=2767879 RepID=A0A9D1ZM20_9LACO|nr:helix-turn-helix transcriptional regulator [Candidatus Companilactobacillus pullicola]
MFLGSVIYDKRRSLNLTQSDLANGLCNQNTISKMEKHNMTPQMDVLIKICQRLDLSLNDVFSEFSSDSKPEQTFILDDVEKDVLLNNLDSVEDKLALIQDKLKAKDRAQYDFIFGVVKFKAGNFELSSFHFDKVLRETKSDDDNIYTLMSYLFKGKIYYRQEHFDEADYYLNLINNSLKENLNVNNANGLEVIFLAKMVGKAYLQIKRFDLAKQISERGLEFANDYHLSYFMDELNYNLYSVYQEGNDKDKQQLYKNRAFYCADVLNNRKLQEKIEHK